jgi:hypothetical protein
MLMRGLMHPAGSSDLARRRQQHAFAALIVAVGIVASVAVNSALGATTWSRNLYRSTGVVFQDPYPTASTAAAVMMMLNFTALRQTGGQGFIWRTSRTKESSDPHNYRDMTSILYWERTHDTLRSSSSGSDPHGWRNALNYYGWGRSAFTDASKRVYDDLQFTSSGAAIKAAVRAIARFNRPVGILGWAGGHAQVMTGYVVTGANPAVSNDFTVRYVYLTDPLRSDGFVNEKISLRNFQSGNIRYRFRAYRESDSPYDDAYSGGWRRSSVLPSVGSSEWYQRWVIIAPVRSGLPGASSTPSPTPTPTPSPTSEPSASPSDSSDSAGATDEAPAQTAPPEESISTEPSATETPTSTPSDEPTASPTPGTEPTSAP